MSANDLERRVRKLEKQLAASEHERKALREANDRLSAAENANKKLRETLERLRTIRAREQAEKKPAPITKEKTVTKLSPPVVESPKRHRARQLPEHARVGVFVDVANISGAARRVFNGQVNYRALLAQLSNGRRLIEARAYTIDKGGGGHEGFARALRQVGFKVQSKSPKTFPDGTVKADWDVGIAVDVMGLRGKLDIVVLASGDGDYLPLVSALRRDGLQVEAAAFGERSAAELKAEVDRFIEFDSTILE